MKRAEGSKLIKKYIRFKPELLLEVKKYVQKNFNGHFVIGVHYRGTDKVFEAERVEFKDLMETIDSILKKNAHRDPIIFLATDDIKAYEVLSGRYKNQLIALDCHRSTGPIGVHYVFKGYEAGKQAVLDCLLLSHTNFMIRTSSSLSAVACFINPDVPIINMNHLLPQHYKHLLLKGDLNELNLKPIE